MRKPKAYFENAIITPKPLDQYMNYLLLLDFIGYRTIIHCFHCHDHQLVTDIRKLH